MHISKVVIKGFRSFGPKVTGIQTNQSLIAFIGLNSAGKTAALEALRKIFGNKSEQQIYREDFHIAHDEDPATVVEKDLSIEVRVEFNDVDDAVASFFSDMVIEDAGQSPYLRIRLEANWTKSDLTQQGDIDHDLYFIRVAEGEEEDVQSRKSFPGYLRSLIQIIYVPAIRKPADQIKYASGSILYRILNNIDYDDGFKKELEGFVEEINDLFKGLDEFTTIQDSLQNLWSRFHKDSRYKESNLNFGSSELAAILKKLEVNFSPGPGSRKFNVDDLGDGYRSLFYLTLVCALLEIEEKLAIDDDVDKVKRPFLTILAIEEPENHIAPQLLGRVVKILLEIAGNSNTQVFLTSHTPAIIKRIDPDAIFHFRISEEATTVINHVELPAKTDEAFKYVKEAVQNYPEIYFAKLVVIGEGDSEEVVLNRLMKTMNKDFDDNIISFAPLGHRFVSHIWKLLTKLQIPYITLLDMDLEREGGGWGRVKYVLKELIACGEKSEEVLLLANETVLSDANLNAMHKRDMDDVKGLKAWKNRVKKYNVFYCYPLDLDFLMLTSFPEYYTGEKSYPKGGGPRIPDEEKKPEAYEEYLLSSIHATLKSEDADGHLYTAEEKKLMIWYKYHFLGRGKPATHIQVLSEIDDEALRDGLPKVFEQLFVRIEELLEK